MCSTSIITWKVEWSVAKKSLIVRWQTELMTAIIFTVCERIHA
ncbi:13548_t:CDS:1, partial [Funneliformis caledonium]